MGRVAIFIQTGVFFFLTACGAVSLPEGFIQPSSDLSTIDGVLDGEHRIFVSSKLFNGDFLAGDDDEKVCEILAQTAGLKLNYVPIISTTYRHAINRISTREGPALLVNDQGARATVVEHVTELWSTSEKQLLHTIDHNEFGKLVGSSNVFTGTLSTGFGDPGEDKYCEDWTKKTAGIQILTGSSAFLTDKWTERSDNTSCATLARIYCLSDSAEIK